MSGIAYQADADLALWRTDPGYRARLVAAARSTAKSFGAPRWEIVSNGRVLRHGKT